MIKYKKNKETAEKENKALLSETVLAEDTEELSLTQKLRERKKTARKKLLKRGGIGAGIAFVGLIFYGAFLPYQGTIPYALCKIVIEMNVPYPHTLKFTEVAELRNGDIRIWFTHTDAFGAFRQEPFLCTFAQNEETGQGYLARARWGTVELEQKQLDAFNQIMPFLIQAQYYDTTYPAALPDSIAEMQLNIDQFRKVNLMDLITQKR